MRAAALLPREAGLDHARGELEEEAELERLRHVVVEERPLVVDDHVLVPLEQTRDERPLPPHLVFSPEDAEVLVHRPCHLVTDRMRAFAFGTPEELP